MIPLVFTLCIILTLFQLRTTATAILDYWSVRNSKDGVKRHFHQEHMMTSIHLLIAILLILALFFFTNLNP